MLVSLSACLDVESHRKHAYAQVWEDTSRARTEEKRPTLDVVSPQLSLEHGEKRKQKHRAEDQHSPLSAFWPQAQCPTPTAFPPRLTASNYEPGKLLLPKAASAVFCHHIK